MLSDALFRIVNTAGGLDLDPDLWRRYVLGPPTRVDTGAIRRRIKAALDSGEQTVATRAGGFRPDGTCRSTA